MIIGSQHNQHNKQNCSSLFSNTRNTNQRSRFEIFDDGVLSDRQVQLVPTQDEPMVDGVSHQVDAGSHHKRDDAEVDC